MPKSHTKIGVMFKLPECNRLSFWFIRYLPSVVSWLVNLRNFGIVSISFCVLEWNSVAMIWHAELKTFVVVFSLSLIIYVKRGKPYWKTLPFVWKQWEVHFFCYDNSSLSFNLIFAAAGVQHTNGGLVRDSFQIFVYFIQVKDL